MTFKELKNVIYGICVVIRKTTKYDFVRGFEDLDELNDYKVIGIRSRNDNDIYDSYIEVILDNKEKKR